MGGVVGGIAGLALLLVVVFLVLRRRRSLAQKGREMSHELPHKGKYEMPHVEKPQEMEGMESVVTEMPASDVPVSEMEQGSSHDHGLGVRNDLNDRRPG